MNIHGRCVKRKQQKNKNKQRQQKQKKKNKQESARDQLEPLPEEIMYEILSRVPVKSLMMFRCVCKRWRSIIQRDKFFHDLHFSMSKAEQRVSLARIGDLRLRLKDMDDDIKCLMSMELLLPSEENGGVASVGAMSLWKNPFPTGNYVFRTTNGLLCVMDLIYGCVCVYNISTRESTRWIKSVIIEQEQQDEEVNNEKGLQTVYSLQRFGLGYDAVTKQHKVIALWNIVKKPITWWNAVATSNELLCEVLTVRNNTWRRIDSVIPKLCGRCPFNLNCSGGTVHVNGSIYWLQCCNPHFEEGTSIIQFDVGSEKFKKINIMLPLENFSDRFLCATLDLIDIDGRFAMLVTDGITSAMVCILSEQDEERKTSTSTICNAASSPNCNYYYRMEETFSKPPLDLRSYHRPQHIPGTDLFMAKSTDDDFSFYYYNWKKKSYSSCKINFETSTPFYFYHWMKKGYSSCKINFETSSSSFKGCIEDVFFTPSLFPVN